MVICFSANENLEEKYSDLRRENESLKHRIDAQDLSLRESEKELRKAIEMATGSGKVRENFVCISLYILLYNYLPYEATSSCQL